MKTLKDFISTGVITEADKGSIRDYMLWHYEVDNIEDFTYDKFASKAFDEKALAKYYGGDLQAMYDELLGLMKAEKKASIDISFRGDERANKIKVGGKTFNTLTSTRWYAEQNNTHLGKDDSKLTYNGQFDFTAYLRTRLEKEGWLEKLNISKRSQDYRFGGLVYFDHVHGVCSKNDRSIKGLTADGSMTYDEAYNVALDYLKKEYK